MKIGGTLGKVWEKGKKSPLLNPVAGIAAGGKATVGSVAGAAFGPLGSAIGSGIGMSQLKGLSAKDIGKTFSVNNLTGNNKRREDSSRRDEQAREEAAAQAAQEQAKLDQQLAGEAATTAAARTKMGQADTDYRTAIDGAFSDALPGLKNSANVNIGTNVDPAFRNYQMQLAQQLQNQAMGQGPSLAQMQLNHATDRTLNQTMGAIRAGAGGGGAGLAARTAALASSQQLGGLGAQSAMMRFQEQRQAQDALAELSGQARGQDLSTAQLGQQAQIAQEQLRQAALGQMVGIGGQKLDAYGNIYTQQGSQAQSDINNVAASERVRLGLDAQANEAALSRQDADAAAKAAQKKARGQGAVAGAAAGAGAGASFGPWGAAGGAVLGGLGGYFSNR